VALELQLSTKSARADLAALNADVVAFGGTLKDLANNKGFENTLAKLSSFKGIEASASQSLNQLARAMQAASAAASSTANISKSLNALARVRVDAVASNLERVSKALNSLRIPPTVERFAAILAKINTSAAAAAQSVRQLGGALNQVRVPAGLNSLSSSLARVNASARSAGGGLVSFGNASASVKNALAGFGIVLGAFGFAQFITSTFDAVRALDNFRNTIRATSGGDLSLVGKELAYVNEIADKTSLSLSSLQQGYAKYSTAARLSGQETAQIHKTFEAVATAARVMGLSAEEVKGTFEALSQMASKGRVSMEELRQQLGDRLPGAVQMMAEGLGYGKERLGEFFDAVSKGSISSAQGIPALTEVLMRRFGSELPNATKTASAAFDQFGNVLTRMQQAFGEGFFNGIKDALSSLAQSMSDPAFVNGARQWGEAFGAAASAVLQAVQLISENFALFKYGILSLLSINVAATVFSWVNSLAVAGQVASTTVRSIGGLVVAFQGLGFVSNLMIGLRAAMLGTAASSVALSVALGPIGLTVAALAVAIPTIIALYNNWSQVSATLSQVTWTVSEGIDKMVSSLSSLVPLPPVVSEGISYIAKAVWDTVTSFAPFAKAIDLVIKLWNYFFPAANKAASATTSVSNAAKTASGSLNQAGTGATNFANGLNRSASAAKNAASAYNAAAAAASRYNAASGGGGGPNHVSVGSSQEEIDAYQRGAGGVSVVSSQDEFFEYDGYKYGGIAGKPTGLKYRLPASAFINAPRFAGGGLSDGGIPAVLHPNEAVVPLTGGGQIPVANMTTGQGSLLLLKPLNLLVDYTKQVKTEVARVWEATTNQTVIMKNALDRIESVLLHIDNVRFTELGNIFSTGLTNLRTSVDNIRISGGGYGGDSPAANYAGMTYAEKLGAQLDKIAANYNYRAANANAWTGQQTGMIMLGGQAVAVGSKKYYEILAQAASARAELIKAKIAAGEYSDAEIQKMYENLMRNQKLPFSPYASGSPNAWKDEKGGFMAVLHPDEAVIPLPDGRSVPVDMPSSFMDHISRLVSEGDARVVDGMRSSGGRVRGGDVININLSFNVSTKDASSFNESRDQIMRNLQQQLDRAMRRVGRTSDVEDPTKRV
jgi:tape measure domain-containing protein